MWPVVQCLWCFSQEQGDTMGSGNKPVVTPCLGQYLLNETSQHIEVVPPFHAELLDPYGHSMTIFLHRS